MISFVCEIEKAEFLETESRLVVETDDEWWMTALGCEVSFWRDENILELDCGNGCITILTTTELYT